MNQSIFPSAGYFVYGIDCLKNAWIIFVLLIQDFSMITWLESLELVTKTVSNAMLQCN